MNSTSKFERMFKKLILLFLISLVWFLVSLLGAVFIARSFSVCKFCGSILTVNLWGIGFVGFQPVIWVNGILVKQRIRIGLKSTLIGISFYFVLEAFCADAFNIGIFAYNVNSTWWTLLTAQALTFFIALKYVILEKRRSLDSN